tara:strand:- start:1 stop:1161 length:1161 start_codon:yes stop_codon:yes gene_type:complete
MKFKNKISDSIESRFSKLAKHKNKNKEKIYSLGLGEPYFETPKSISKKAFTSIISGNTRYSDAKGSFNLRKIISTKYNKKYNIDSSPNHFLITPGSKFGLYLVLKSILNPGDSIINISPCYPSYEPQIYLSEPKAKIITINLEKSFDLNISKLKKKITTKTKAIIINSPNNPTGKIYTEKELIEIYNLLKKNKCWIILDLIYEDLSYLNHNIINNKHILNYEKLILVSGFSKSYSMTGWRIGYIFTKNKLLDLMFKINQHLITNVPLFIQDASIEALKNHDNQIKKFNKELKLNYEYLLLKLSKLGFKIPSYVGGMFIFIDISKFGLKSDIFCEKLLNEYKVAATPGIFFGSSWDSHIRISLSNYKNEFKLAINKLANFISSLKNN